MITSELAEASVKAIDELKIFAANNGLSLTDDVVGGVYVKLCRLNMDFNKQLEQVARDACDMKNSIHRTARDLMNEQYIAQFLDDLEPMATFEGLVEKCTGPKFGLRGDAFWNRIIDSSMKGRGLVDILFFNTR